MSAEEEFDSSRMHPDMRRLYNEAVEASQQGDAQRFEESMLAAVRAAPSPWAYGRWYVFELYTCGVCALFKRGVITRSDKKALQSFLNSREEPALFRMRAASCLSLISANDDMEQMADYTRQILEIAEQVDPQDLGRPLAIGDRSNTTVGKEVEELVTEANDTLLRLDRLFNPAAQAPVQRETIGPNPGGFSERAKATILHCPYEMFDRLTFGGRSCDCCGKTLEELGVARLNCCTKCKKSYYCSKECQRKQWKAGHKKACREPDDIRQGDYMRIKGLVVGHELNECIVSVKGQDPNEQGNWIVEVAGSEPQEVSVATKNLLHIRPAV